MMCFTAPMITSAPSKGETEKKKGGEGEKISEKNKTNHEEMSYERWVFLWGRGANTAA